MKKLTQIYTRKFSIVISALILIGSTNTTNHEYKYIERPNHINNYLGSDANVKILEILRKEYIVIQNDSIQNVPTVTDEGIFLVSGYDLSYQSCSKSRDDNDFGITQGGYNLKGKTYKSARIISVDTNLIPLGTKVKLTFIDQKYKKYDSSDYIASDTGNLIKGKHIDLFLADFNSQYPNKIVREFGLTKCKLEIIKE